MFRFSMLTTAGALALAAQSYRAEILAGPGEVREGPARETQLRGVGPLALSAAGEFVFADFAGRRIWRVTGGGRLELVAGGDAALVGPRALAFDAAGNLYFVDGNYIRRIDAVTGAVSRFAGNGLWFRRATLRTLAWRRSTRASTR